MFHNIVRTTKFACQNFGRNLWLSLVTIFILILTLFSISLVLTLNFLGKQAISAVQEKVDIDIYFSTAIPESKILAVQNFLSGLQEVKEVKYISAEDALSNFSMTHVDDPAIKEALAALEKNPLPASLVIKAKTIDNYTAIMEKFNASEFASLAEKTDFQDHRVVIDRIKTISKTIYQFGIILSGIFMFISILVVFNTIRLTIYAQREELGIMKLVGATNWFIRAPFILESILYAILGSLATMAILYPLVVVANPYVNNFFIGYNFNLLYYFNQYFLPIFFFEFIVAVVLSVFSSMAAIGKHLKV